MYSNLSKILSRLERYKDFTILSEPSSFKELYKDKNIDIVQLHSISPIGDKDIVGFCGAFSWKDNKLTPLDGDSYSASATVYGYSWFSNDEVKTGLDILVGDDW